MRSPFNTHPFDRNRSVGGRPGAISTGSSFRGSECPADVIVRTETGGCTMIEPQLENPTTEDVQTRMRVLIADDDVAFRQSLQLILMEWGYEVETVPDGNRAWEYLQSDSPDLALMDWMMPGLTGVDLCRKVRESEESNGTYLILLSARTASEDIAMGLRAGADDYVTKPIDFLELQARIQVGFRMVRLRRQLTDRKQTLEARLREISRLQTQADEARQRERFLAFHDSLTGLANRQLFFDHMRQAISQANRSNHLTAVLFLDLDGFKEVNDVFGHPAGDQVLRKVAHRIRNSVREVDTVARLGGDEFAVTACNLSTPMEAAIIAEKLLQNLSEAFIIEGQACHVGASIGISLCPAGGQDVQTLVKQADVAMYQAKRQGKNCFVLYDAAIDARVQQRLGVEKELRLAVGRQELVLHYQPLVNLATSTMIGIEALLRWQHPASELMYPTEFIPLAEETGLIIPIGAWALRTACTNSAQKLPWQAAVALQSPHFRTAVNLSARQFLSNHLVMSVAEVLEQTGHVPQCLELEITESAAMQNVDHSIATMRQLKDMGVRLAIDDFGTGYSSLSHLKRFPVDTLKIDRSFISGIPHDPNDVAITRTIVSLASSLKVGVLAEGVETKDQCEFLRSIGCDEAQGHLFSPPVASEQMREVASRVFALGG